jgi:hypothetical protein
MDDRRCGRCEGIVVIGSTVAERNQGAVMGLLLWGGVPLFILYVLPTIVNAKFDWKIPTAGLVGLIPVLVFGFWGAITGAGRVDVALRNQIRVFPPR